MAILSFIIGIIGNVVSILVFASPIKTFWGVVNKKSTEDYEGLPYIATLLSTSLWSFYGILKPGGLLVLTVNGAGALLQLSYVTLFFIYAPKKKKMTLMKLIGLMDVGGLGTVIAVALLAFHGSMRVTFVGIICAGFTLGMYGSPLSIMGTVIKTQSVEFMPFSLSFFLFLNGGIWSVYALLVMDYFIGVPNGIGFVLGSIQVTVYAIYWRKSKKADPTDKIKGEGSGHPVKGALEMSAVDQDTEKIEILPNPHVSPQNGLQKIAKKLSLSPQELQSGKPDDLENGRDDRHP